MITDESIYSITSKITTTHHYLALNLAFEMCELLKYLFFPCIT